ncbi:MAG: acyl-CoA dehydratase activase-related protein [Eggerthellaceae bacterium]|nr:acyl-CoA dehydratase activase-related protein [Eggerthellaceae bacterium]
MAKITLRERDYADVRVVGIPRGLLFYRYGAGWRTFFEALGRTVVTSPETDKAIVDAGTRVSIDECCLASKAYLGHVANLVGRCDAVFVPCYASADARAGFCTKFQSAPDLVASTFRDQGVRVMSMLVDRASNDKAAREAFTELALRMGASAADAKRACKTAHTAQTHVDKKRAAAQEATLRHLDEQRKAAAGASSSAASGVGGSATPSPSAAPAAPAAATSPLAILLVAHPYLAHDRFMCGTVVDALERMGATVVFADETNHDRAFKRSFDFSATLPWRINRELIGSILMLQDRIDGIVLVSAFPCGPDSMTDDAVMRCIQGTPILNLMVDAQSGTAGVETRVESFVDILRFQQMGGYIHG